MRLHVHAQTGIQILRVRTHSRWTIGLSELLRSGFGQAGGPWTAGQRKDAKAQTPAGGRAVSWQQQRLDGSGQSTATLKNT
jgi:hypothetical protein